MRFKARMAYKDADVVNQYDSERFYTMMSL